MRHTIIAILCLAFAASGDLQWLASGDSPYLLRALAYPFFHANIFHLAVNCMALWSMLDPRYTGRGRDILCGFFVSFLVYPLSLRPVIGISNVIFAMFGMRTPSLSSSWWRDRRVHVFFAVTVLLALVPSVAASTHIASFILGAAIAAGRRALKRLDDDTRRACR